MIQVYIVDDHPFVREGLKTFLGAQQGIELVGEAGSGEEALTEIQALQPEIVVVDLHLPGMGGVELTRKIREVCVNAKIIILSSFSEEDEVIDAIEAGALSYLLKDSSPAKLVEAIQAAQLGEPVLHPRIAKRLMQRVRRQEPAGEQLTVKEKEVLALLIQGRSNKEMAGELWVSDTTIKSHVSSILRKLEVNDRTQAVIKAMKERLLEK
ncbi:MAG TPA: DNA-binding response regulator [Firmicutes bacterium]|nr:DNA-binding response regulator [Bacillota bacterium]HBK67906.1 DNA-binding response regulator [Bacillota bacterium]HBT15614.1 DNA-binding response regulator [Bacillota bacterium]